ncbi:Hsp70 family protein [Streptomyces sp. NBC_01477]|uniref:Hsp70 family protein n=1 Tax=Streptomyces sp. NBC_01477 TaxID=2976015 RepID=UPI002E374F4E|nr:Hsp70 family protein [Streptomyces sp. NBC_01477]
MLSRSSDGAPRALRKALRTVERRFRPTALTARELDGAAPAYGDALVRALGHDAGTALRLYGRFDARLPAEAYPKAFGPAELVALHGLADHPDRSALTVVAAVAGRLGDRALERTAAGRLTARAAEQDGADDLVALLGRWQDRGLLDLGLTTDALRAYTARAALTGDAALWSAFFDHLAEPLLPDLYPVRLFLGRGADAVRLADTAARRRQALACCTASPRLDDVLAGLALAGSEGAADDLRLLAERAGDLLLAAGRPDDALAHYERAGRQDGVSRCHEARGDHFAALDTCAGEDTDRLASLAAACTAEAEAHAERQDTAEALRLASVVLTHLERAAEHTEPVLRRRAEAQSVRAALVAVERRRLEQTLHQAPDGERAAVHQEWSHFEEAAGESAEAARHAAEAGDLYRAHRLYRAAERYGDADRVLKGDDSPRGRAARAAAREAGGDLLGAAGVHEEAGRYEEAAALYARADDPAAAARCLIAAKGDDAVEDPRLHGFLRQAGDIGQLVRLCLDALDRAGLASSAADVLRQLVAEDDTAIPGPLRHRVREALDAVGAVGRGAFEERVADWVARARADVDHRFAATWGLDLGTSTCVAAVYDSLAARPVICPDGGKAHFASTLTVTDRGEEIVGLTGDQVLAPWVVGHISAAKRRMGDGIVYRIRDREYRPEEVAARLIRHARTLVEKLLHDHVKERLAELARAEIGQVRDEWLVWAAERHDFGLERPDAILTIPAYFLNNAKHATRDACAIAGVTAVRLIHEPTAACMAAAQQRRLDGQIVVVDLGAGTLDVSALDVDSSVYDVEQVLGDNQYGGQDFDALIADELAEQLRAQGLDVPSGGRTRRRLALAAEHLKIALSSQDEAEYTLNAFLGRPEVRVALDRTELARLLAGSLRTLRDVCKKMRADMAVPAKHLVLVGGPMLSPLVSGAVERVFDLKRTVLADPRAAVACGAALQGAALTGHLKDSLLLDVTPFPLGIAVLKDDGSDGFSVLVERNTKIPVKRSDVFTTVTDNQSEVRIEVYNGQLDPRSRIGVVPLTGIPPLAMGEPQIEVTFEFDASCVLTVTATDKGTGRSRSVDFTDTTLLSPQEIRAMSERHLDQREVERIHRELRELVEGADDDCERVCREFRERLSAHRPSHEPVDAATQRVLAEMYGPESAELENELLSLRGPLLDLLTTVRDYLALPGSVDRIPAGRHLADQLGERLGRMRRGMARMARWNDVLASLAAIDRDPLRRFRSLHDAGDHGRALRALDELAEPPALPEDLRRRLRCLAGVGDAEGYRRFLLEDAARLPAVVRDPARPERFAAAAGAALVRVGDGSGFLVSDRHVVTSRRWLAADRTATVVRLADGPRTVQHAFLPDASAIDTAVLLLARPAPTPPLRLGFPRLTHIGDLVWAAAPGEALRPGIIEKFEPFPEHGLQVYRTDLRLTPAAAGGPLLNELGEVIGTLVPGGASQPAFAVTADSLAPLLVSAGFGLTGGGDGGGGDRG